MSWYYAEEEKQIGPVTESEFQAALKKGVITDETLVWRQGFPNWVKHRAARRIIEGGPAAGFTAPCVRCKKEFPVGELANFGGDRICATCKPAYVRKLKEGVRTGPGVIYAGFWIRFVALMMDGIAIYLPLWAIDAESTVSLFRWNATFSSLTMTDWIYGVLAPGAYTVFFNGQFGATPGKMLLKLKIVRPNGERITYLRAFVRCFAEALSMFTLLGYLIAVFDPQKRTLHDWIAGTRVVRR